MMGCSANVITATQATEASYVETVMVRHERGNIVSLDIKKIKSPVTPTVHSTPENPAAVGIYGIHIVIRQPRLQFHRPTPIFMKNMLTAAEHSAATVAAMLVKHIVKELSHGAHDMMVSKVRDIPSPRSFGKKVISLSLKSCNDGWSSRCSRGSSIGRSVLCHFNTSKKR